MFLIVKENRTYDQVLGDIGKGNSDPSDAQYGEEITPNEHALANRFSLFDNFYDDGLESNETSVVELGDGTLYINTRDQNGKMPGTRADAFSKSGGETFEATGLPEWKAFKPCPELLDPPVVQCSLLRITDKGTKPLVVFSGPDDGGPSGGGRKDLRLRLSDDEALTWRDGPLIHTGPAAYSDLVEIRPGLGELGILFEAGDTGGKSCNRIDFTVVSRKQLARRSTP